MTEFASIYESVNYIMIRCKMILPKLFNKIHISTYKEKDLTYILIKIIIYDNNKSYKFMLKLTKKINKNDVNLCIDNLLNKIENVFN